MEQANRCGRSSTVKLGMIDRVTKEIRRMDREAEKLCTDRYPATGVLRQVKGVGALTALGFVLTLEDPSRFPRSRDVGAYLGLAPKEWKSGNSNPQLRITRAGDGFVRRLLVNCAHYILGQFGKDSNLRRYGLKLHARGGKYAKKKAAVAVARKLAVLMHRLWSTGEVYEPLYGQPALAYSE